MNTNYLQVGSSHCFTCHKDFTQKTSEHACMIVDVTKCEKCFNWILKAIRKENYKFCPHCGEEI